jgi:UNC-50 family
MIQSSPVVSDYEAVATAAVAAQVDTPVTTTTTTKDSNDIEDDNNDSKEMSSEATHSRKSRLSVPAGGDEVVPTSSSSAVTTGGGGSSAGTVTTATTTGASSSSAGAGASSASSSASGLPLLSRKHRHGGAGAAAAGTGSGMSSVLLSSSNSLRPMHYLSRLTDVRQMDIQSALDQMKTLLSTRPQVVYKTSYYRKQTKNHWARDDPAFCALQALFLLVAAIAYSVAFRCTWTGAISFILYAVIWNWLGMGLILATTCREIANRQLNGVSTQTSVSHVRQQVEWLYAFDIHCNAFFPVFVVLCKKQDEKYISLLNISTLSLSSKV